MSDVEAASNARCLAQSAVTGGFESVGIGVLLGVCRRDLIVFPDGCAAAKSAV
jgi:hypothetical protein